MSNIGTEKMSGDPSGIAATPQFTTGQFAWLLTATSMGTMFEWYDYFLFAVAAAAVWPKIFFPLTFDPAAALAVSVASVGTAQLARPIGAIVFGHFGDKYGRRNTLVWTLILMGIASLGTAILPPYASIGMLAVVPLFIFRFIMGVGLGGEGGGAFSWIAEARPNAKHRGFWVSWPNAVLDLGKLLSVFAFYLVSVSMTSAAYMDWGWRVPFAVGAVMLLIALLIRVKVMESPMFQQLQAKRNVLKYPAFQVVKEQGRKIFTMLWLHCATTTIPSLVILPYSVSFLVKLGMNESFSNLSVTAGTAVAFFTMLGGGYVSDYVGRIKVLRIASVFQIAVLFPYFWLLQTLNPTLIIIAQILLYGVVHLPSGSNVAIFAESFATKYRYSGTGLTFQLSNFVNGILTALILPLFLVTYGVLGTWQPVVCCMIALALIAIAASFFVKDTKGATLE
jgi:MFS family permease